MGVQNAEAESYKNKGNEQFKTQNFDEAISCYSKAIKLVAADSRDAATYLKNRAAAHLKRKEYELAIRDCDDALKAVPEDPKALFRRAQALEALERFEEAYRDARTIFNAEPGNKALQPMLARLHAAVQERARQHAQVANKVEQMMKLAFDVGAERDKREKAINNLLVLSKEKAGAEAVFAADVLRNVRTLLKLEKSEEMCVSAVRLVAQLCKRHAERTLSVLQTLGVPWFLEVLDSEEPERVSAAQYCLQVILDAFSGADGKRKPDAAQCERHREQIDTLLTCLTVAITDRVISGRARDAVVELVMKNSHHDALGWAERFVELKGPLRLLEVCSELEEYRYESCMRVTPSSRTVAAVCLARIYENMYYDQLREKFNALVDQFVKEKLLAPDMESKVRVTVAITSLLLGPLDVGNAVLSKEGIMEMILVMAQTDDPLQQKVACECIIAAASKKDKARAIVNRGVDILKKLYQSKDESIRVRALVGLCKVGSFGGDDASVRPFADGSTTKLADACRRFLVNPSKDKDMRKWAAEGLSYLTLDADVKEKLAEDRAAVRALLALAESGDQSALYGVATTLVNLVNAYEKQELVPELVELAKFAKQHVPEQHELDDPDFVNKRISILAREGVTAALVALSKTESHNSKELIARVFNAVCSQQELRGLVVQQGGARALLPLALEGTDNGKRQAAQALARIGITIDPEAAFPGQRKLEVVRPLVALLHPDRSGLENFEALMALCNLAGADEATRARILKEGGLAKIEHYMYEDHLLLQRAATQCITNLVQSPQVVEVYEGDNDRAKYLYMQCQDEDGDTAQAAAGALCVLTDASVACCRKLLDLGTWLETLHCLLANPRTDVQYRGAYLLHNILRSDRAVAEKIFETDVMEILMALTKLEEPSKAKVKEYAEKCLEAAETMRLIQKPAEFDPFQQKDEVEDLE